jgi:hypothetical protein
MSTTKTQYYFESKDFSGGMWCRGRVYHFDESGNKEIEDFLGINRNAPEEAIDDAAEWLEDHDLEGEMIL